MSILDENAAENAFKDAKIKELEEKIKSLEKFQEWMDEEMYGDRPRWHKWHTRSEKLSKLYHMFYGDSPLDCYDGRTGFFMEIDYIYNVLIKNRWLVWILRKLGGRYYHSDYLPYSAKMEEFTPDIK